MFLARYIVGIIFTPKGTPGQDPPPVKVKTVVGSMFPQSQEPADLKQCYLDARMMQNAVATTMDRIQESTGVFGAWGTYLEPVRAPDA